MLGPESQVQTENALCGPKKDQDLVTQLGPGNDATNRTTTKLCTATFVTVTRANSSPATTTTTTAAAIAITTIPTTTTITAIAAVTTTAKQSFGQLKLECVDLAKHACY